MLSSCCTEAVDKVLLLFSVSASFLGIRKKNVPMNPFLYILLLLKYFLNLFPIGKMRRNLSMKT